MEFTIIQTLLHVENTSWTDKKTNTSASRTNLYFVDPKTTKLTKFSYKNDVNLLSVGSSYTLVVKPYNVKGENGSTYSGYSIVSLTPVK